MFSFTVPEMADSVLQQIFLVFGFVLLFSFGLVPFLVGFGQPTVGRYFTVIL